MPVDSRLVVSAFGMVAPLPLDHTPPLAAILSIWPCLIDTRGLRCRARWRRSPPVRVEDFVMLVGAASEIRCLVVRRRDRSGGERRGVWVSPGRPAGGKVTGRFETFHP